MSVFFSSDFHFRHRLVAGLRGFTKPDENGALVSDRDAHDAALVENWNRVVGPADVAWVLGDVGIGNEDEILELVSRLNGRKQLIPGNHDSCHPMHRTAWKKQRKWLQVFESVQAFTVVSLAGHIDVALSHFPYEGDHTREDRFDQWRLRDSKLRLLHGHVHSSVRRTGISSVHIGLDAWGLKPASEADVLREFRKPQKSEESE